MSAEKTLALVLRVVEFSETSSVLSLFTREFGKIRGLAKGARRPKSPFESALDLLGLCRIVFLPKSSETLDLLTEAKLERRFRPAARDLSRLYAGYYVAELLNELTHDRDPYPELFDAACDALRALGSTEFPVAAVVQRFELNTLRLLGHLPALDACAGCGVPLPSTARVAFGIAAGGVLCARCRPGKRQVVSLSAAALAAMRRLAEAGGSPTMADDSAAVERATAADAGNVAGGMTEADRFGRRLDGELRGVLNQYLCYLIGHRPRMHGYLGNLSG
ncbi:MAG TPA: DNA repair protein RecO [Pirellulales bacterium]|jgi:DNA repair protein RecO (recombination protein O)|nr:DNA repair protein RecO [Pirellulales bacterium]